uniref:Ubiquitin-protein ligase E3B n=1 Tax=Lygus hesperus TaxID=30085 RepID=A0A0A9X1G9_LYGHE
MLTSEPRFVFLMTWMRLALLMLLLARLSAPLSAPSTTRLQKFSLSSLTAVCVSSVIAPDYTPSVVEKFTLPLLPLPALVIALALFTVFGNNAEDSLLLLKWEDSIVVIINPPKNVMSDTKMTTDMM